MANAKRAEGRLLRVAAAVCNGWRPKKVDDFLWGCERLDLEANSARASVALDVIREALDPEDHEDPWGEDEDPEEMGLRLGAATSGDRRWP